MFKVCIAFLNFILGARRERSFRKRLIRRTSSLWNSNISEIPLFNNVDSSTIVSKYGEASTKQVKRIESYLDCLVRDGIVFKKEDLTQSQISSLAIVVHYLIYLQSDENLTKFLEEDIYDVIEKKRSLSSLFLNTPKNIKKILSKDEYLEKLFNFKFEISKINIESCNDPTILELTDKLMSNYILNKVVLGFQTCRSEVFLILYKLKKYYKASL